MIRTARCVLAVGCWLGFSVASSAESDRAGTVAALMKLSGIERQILPLAEQLVDQLLAGQARESMPGLNVLLATAARREFAADKLLAEIRERLLQDVDEEKAAVVIDWLKGAIGTRITALEEVASHESSAAALETYAMGLEANPPRPERVALLQRLDTSMEISAFTTEVVLATARASALAFNAAGKTPRPEGDVRDAVERQREQLAPALAAFTRVALLKSYHDASDADLLAYTEFLETAEGRWYNRVMSGALLASYENATRRMADAAAAVVQTPPESKAL